MTNKGSWFLKHVLTLISFDNYCVIIVSIGLYYNYDLYSHCPAIRNIKVEEIIKSNKINPNWGGGGKSIILRQKLSISPEPNIRCTSDPFVNSSLSVVVQKKQSVLSKCKKIGPLNMMDHKICHKSFGPSRMLGQEVLG